MLSLSRPLVYLTLRAIDITYGRGGVKIKPPVEQEFWLLTCVYRGLKYIYLGCVRMGHRILIYTGNPHDLWEIIWYIAGCRVGRNDHSEAWACR